MEEEDKGGNQTALRQIFAAQFRHAGDERVAAGHGNRYLAAQRVSGITDIGIAQKQEGRLLGNLLRMLDTLADGPELAGPSRGQRLARQHRQPCGGAGCLRCGFGDVGRAVAALIVDQNHLQRTGIILTQERADGEGDHIGFIACRHDRHHIGPAFGRGLGRWAIRRLAFPTPPEIAPGHEEINPGGERQKGDEKKRAHGRYPARRNQAMASASPSVKGRAR